MLRIVAAVLVALVGLMAYVAPAGAGEEWCDSDPVVPVTTPKGNVVVVYVLTGAAGTEHLPAVLAAEYRYTATAAGGGARTLVELDVLVPADAASAVPFATRAAASTGPLKSGTLLGSATGWSGQPMRLRFELDVP